MLGLALILMQVLISAKAGLVNYTQGPTNVRLHQQVTVAEPIQTGPRGHAELLLNPGSFLRLDESSTAVLDSVDLTNIDVRIVSGAAVLEAADIDKHAPINVTTGNLKVRIVSAGVYRFSGDTAEVFDGKLQTADLSRTVKKGEQITAGGSVYLEGKIQPNAMPDGFDLWSRQRSQALAKANALARNGYSSTGSYSTNPIWFYSPMLAGFTFFPGHNYRSFYGYTFLPLFVARPHGSTRPASQTHVQKNSPPSSAATHPRSQSGAAPAHQRRGGHARATR